METILNSISATGIICFCLMPFLLVAAVLIYRLGKKQKEQEEAYEILYSWIQNDILDHEPYDYVRKQIAELEKLPYKNQEKTQKLKESFRKAYPENCLTDLNIKLKKYVKSLKAVEA
jgi:hypothetical protein